MDKVLVRAKEREAEVKDKADGEEAVVKETKSNKEMVLDEMEKKAKQMGKIVKCTKPKKKHNKNTHIKKAHPKPRTSNQLKRMLTHVSEDGEHGPKSTSSSYYSAHEYTDISDAD